MQEQKCQRCGSNFKDYLSNHRKYCGWECKKKSMEKEYSIICGFCKAEFISHKYNKKYCSLHCSGRANNKLIVNRHSPKLNGRKENHWAYKGGSVHKGTGYKYLSYLKKKTLEHRQVMEDYLGRKLEKTEHVHHINGNKLDNRVENLMVLSPSDHQKLHLRIRHGLNT